MGIMMVVMLYTSRIVLNTLGVNDYGIWNVIASFVVSFSFISSPLVTATQRFLNYDMGKGGERLREIFSISFELFLVIGVLMIVVLETIGLWFLNNKMNFESERMTVVNWTYQFSVFSLFIKFIRLPYESTIVAQEKMSFYAIICMVEAFLLLGIVYLLKIGHGIEKLVLYGLLTFSIQLIITLCYKLYCNRNFKYTKIRWFYNSILLKEIGSFSGWNLITSIASMSASSGLNILLNMFFGIVVNAAFSITTQIGSAVSQFVSNFQKAVNPQIVKNYAHGDIQRLNYLLYNTSKFSFLLMFLIVFPMYLNMEYGLKLWLGDKVPEITTLFCRIYMVYLLIICSATVFDTAILATGNIRNYQLTLSSVVFLNVILTYIFFKNGFLPQSTLYIKTGVEILVFYVRILFLKRRVEFSIKSYIKTVIGPIIMIVGFCMLGMHYCLILFDYGDNLHKLIYTTLTFLPLYISSVWFIGIDKEFKQKILSTIYKKCK